MAVAVFNTRSVQGEVAFKNTINGLRVEAIFTRLPEGEHGFHIHRAGDLRGEGCKNACDHYHRGPPTIPLSTYFKYLALMARTRS